MTILIIICDLEVNKHKIDKYVIVLLYIIEKNDQENEIRTMFRRKIYLMNDLKTNILIKINIMSFENIVVNLIICTTRIENCNVIVLIKIQTSNNVVFKSIHFRKSITIFSRLEILIEIHYFAILENRNFLFELNEILHFISYAHLIDVTTKTIILRNNTNRLMHISRNYRLKKLFEIKYFNVFYIDVDDIDKTKEFAS